VTETRRRRANGEVSRQRILDAAGQIAGERGYEGTSINLVSDRSGLPPSSIYWHFKDKDELIAAVIERSFGQWVERLQQPLTVPEGASRDDVFRLGLQRTGRALADFPDFLRLGLMLILERRPEEPSARARYLEAREITASRVARFYGRSFPDLGEGARDQLVTLTMALADGLFVASEVDGTPLEHAFDLMATAILGTAEQLRARPTPHPAAAGGPSSAASPSANSGSKRPSRSGPRRSE
jgi:AcrR family transcriptional regulator